MGVGCDAGGALEDVDDEHEHQVLGRDRDRGKRTAQSGQNLWNDTPSREVKNSYVNGSIYVIGMQVFAVQVFPLFCTFEIFHNRKGEME